MGQILGGGPHTAKESSNGRDQALGVCWGSSGMQGWRERMEDAHLAFPSLAAQVGPGARPGWEGTAIFGVMDGHGGEHVAKFCERHLPSAIASFPAEDVELALVGAFHRMDEMLCDPKALQELRSLSNDILMKPVVNRPNSGHPDYTGCTAVLCSVRQREIHVANVGDSRAVLCRYGSAVEMSQDHKPDLPNERDRIHKAGGSIYEQKAWGMTQYRVNGNLNMSRSIGDLLYKQNTGLSAQEQMICCHPDVRHFKRQAGDDFMIIACDGIWDVMTSQAVVDFIRARLGPVWTVEDRVQDGSLRLSEILEELLDNCVSPDPRQTQGLGGDNMTAILVVFTEQPDNAYGDGPLIEGFRHSPLRSWLCQYR